VIVGLDHVGLAVADPAAALRAYGLLFGAQASDDGRFQLANTALRITQGSDAPAFSLGFAAAAVAETRRTLERRGLSTDGDHFALAATHGVAICLAPAIAAEAPPARSDAPHALDHVVIMTTDPERAVALYGGRLGLDLRLDRANPQWGARQLFFRCGGTVVEIAADLKAPVADSCDRITGLAWRVTDPAAAQARLAGAGFDVSPVRAGRKPGTTVFTLRTGVPGAPALMLGAEPVGTPAP
jgi:catechol 2,3-dioxygenase-like lactoylglutathione lyase family enzyme